jgi:hypothetical protein
MRAGLLLVAVVALGCGRGAPKSGPGGAAEGQAGPAAASSAGGAPGAPPVSAAEVAPPAPSPAACPARRPFSDLGSEADRRLVLPAPFAGFDACDVLSALYPDYDRQTERSASAGGAVRADKAFLFRTRGRELLAVTRYAGADAEQGMLCGCCSAKALVALLEAQGGRLARVAEGDQPVDHGGLNDGVTLAATQLPVREGEELLTLDAAHSCGTSPGRHFVHGFRLQGSELRRVLSWRTAASGMGPGADLVSVTATPVPRKGKGDLFDLAFPWTRAPCPFDEGAGDYVCKGGKPIGTELLRFDGTTYRLAGARAHVDFFD